MSTSVIRKAATAAVSDRTVHPFQMQGMGQMWYASATGQSGDIVVSAPFDAGDLQACAPGIVVTVAPSEPDDAEASFMSELQELFTAANALDPAAFDGERDFSDLLEP